MNECSHWPRRRDYRTLTVYCACGAVSVTMEEMNNVGGTTGMRALVKLKINALRHAEHQAAQRKATGISQDPMARWNLTPEKVRLAFFGHDKLEAHHACDHVPERVDPHDDSRRCRCGQVRLSMSEMMTCESEMAFLQRLAKKLIAAGVMMDAFWHQEPPAPPGKPTHPILMLPPPQVVPITHPKMKKPKEKPSVPQSATKVALFSDDPEPGERLIDLDD